MAGNSCRSEWLGPGLYLLPIQNKPFSSDLRSTNREQQFVYINIRFTDKTAVNISLTADVVLYHAARVDEASCASVCAAIQIVCQPDQTDGKQPARRPYLS
jgi:hypothetical protein